MLAIIRQVVAVGDTLYWSSHEGIWREGTKLADCCDALTLLADVDGAWWMQPGAVTSLHHGALATGAMRCIAHDAAHVYFITAVPERAALERGTLTRVPKRGGAAKVIAEGIRNWRGGWDLAAGAGHIAWTTVDPESGVVVARPDGAVEHRWTEAANARALLFAGSTLYAVSPTRRQNLLCRLDLPTKQSAVRHDVPDGAPLLILADGEWIYGRDDEGVLFRIGPRVENLPPPRGYTLQSIARLGDELVIAQNARDHSHGQLVRRAHDAAWPGAGSPTGGRGALRKRGHGLMYALGFDRVLIGGESRESMWAEPIAEGLYRLNNIPNLSNYNVRDVVRCEDRGDDELLEVVALAERGPDRKLTATVPQASIEDPRVKALMRRLLKHDLDRLGPETFLFSVPRSEYDAFVEALDPLEDEGLLEFELWADHY